MNAILCSVDYSDLLALSLPWNRRHFDEVMVVTSLSDSKTVEIALANNCKVHRTNAFYKVGSDKFMKWAALEEGLDVLGRKGWIAIMDADIVIPKDAINPYLFRYLQCGYLYSPRRYMMEDTSTLLQKGIPIESEWDKFPVHPQSREHAGYLQIFHAEDSHLGNPPWHQTDWIHCGGADSFFQAKWGEECKIRPNFKVLHLGPSGINWLGRTSAYLDNSIPNGSETKLNTLRDMIKKRGTHPSKDRFGYEKMGGV